MLKLETDFIKLEYDDKLTDVSGGIINDILDKVFSYTSIPFKERTPAGPSFTSDTVDSINSPSKYDDNIKPEEDTIIDMRNVSLPRCSSDLTCPSCHQSFLMKTANGEILFKNYNDGKIYNLGEISIPGLPKGKNQRLTKLNDIYEDCVDLCKHVKKDNVVFISNSEDKLICPFCGEEVQIKDMLDYVIKENTNEKCFICGSETEITLLADGAITVKSCTNKKCQKC